MTFQAPTSELGSFVLGSSPLGGPVVGGQTDIVRRMLAVLPSRWFADNPPVLTALLTGIAWVWSRVYFNVMWVRRQARIATADDVNLDMIAADFFGLWLPRAGMDDATYRAAIQMRLLRQGGTRAGMISEITRAAGQAPAVIEGWNPGDCGAWGGGPIAIGYGLQGAWGTRRPAQVFLRVQTDSGSAAGIYATAADMRAAGVDVWVQIAGSAGTAPLDDFQLDENALA